MPARSQRALDFEGPSNRVPCDSADSKFSNLQDIGVWLEERDRLHWARSQLTSALDHQSSELKLFSRLKRGESACVEGQLAQSLFLVQRGLLKLSLVSEEGSQCIVEILGAGDCFGEECATEDYPYHAETAIALMPTNLVKIARNHVLRMLEQSTVCKLFIRVLTHRVHKYEVLLAQHVFETSEQRLARVIMRLSKFGHWQNSNTVVVPRLTHETLAEIVGTTRSRITSFLGNFANRGIIRNYGSGVAVRIDRLSEEILAHPWDR